MIHRTVLIVFSFFILQSSFAEGPFTFVSDPFPPYVISNAKTGSVTGFMPIYVRKIFDKIDGATVRFESMSWERCKKDVESGHRDAIMQMRYSKERAQKYIFTRPHTTANMRLYYSIKNHPRGISWSKLSDLSNYTIAAVKGYYYGENISKAVSKNNLTLRRYSHPRDLINQVIAGRVDLFLADENVARYYIEKAGVEGRVGVVDRIIDRTRYYFAISKKSELGQYVDQINKQIHEMSVTGTDKELFDKLHNSLE